MLIFAGALRGPRLPLAAMNKTRKSYAMLGLLSLAVLGALGTYNTLHSGQDWGRGLGATHIVEARTSKTALLTSTMELEHHAARSVEVTPMDRVRLSIQSGAQVSGPPTDPHRSASLAIQVTSHQVGTQASIEFLDGANAGWVGETEADGSLHVEHLEPGCMNVRVQTPSGETCVRLVQVRRNSEFTLNFGPTPPHRLVVQDHGGQPLVPDWIWVQGQTWTPRDASIAVTPTTTGKVAFRIGKAGYATMGGFLDGDENGPRTLVLEPACALQVLVEGPAHLRGLARVQVIPMDPGIQLFAVEGMDLALVHMPQASIGFPDLPRGRVRVIVTHPSGVGRSQPIKLVPGEARHVTVKIEAGQQVHGQITRDGVPFSNATATFHPTQFIRIKHKAFAGSTKALLGLPIDCLAGTPLRLHTDATGNFTMTLPPFDVAHEGRFLISGPKGYGDDFWVEWSAADDQDQRLLHFDLGGL